MTLENPTINGGTLSTANGGTLALEGATINTAVTNTASGTVLIASNSTVSGVLTNAAGGQVTIGNGASLTLTGSTLNNSGNIQMSPSSSNANLVIGASNLTLSGGGSLTMSYVNALSGPANSIIEGAVPTDVLTNQSTIQGSGNIGYNQMGLVNSGTINATQGYPLTIQTSNGTTNTGTLEATGGGTLILLGDTYTNTGGTILASGTGSVVTLSGPTINGGALNTSGGGVIQAAGDPVLNGVTNSGTYQIPGSNSTTIAGTITNSGNIQLNGTSYGFTPEPANLIIGGSAVTLTGGGTVTLGSGYYNTIYGASAADVLTNVNNTIQGSGNIGDGQMRLVNQGTIDGNQSAALTVQTSNGLTNSGTLEATNGGTLTVEVGTGGAANTGTIQAASGSTLEIEGGTYRNSGGTIQNAGNTLLENVTINGGTVSQTGAGDMQLSGANIDTTVSNSSAGTVEALSGTSNTINKLSNPTGGQLLIDTGATVTLTQATSDAGAISVNGTLDTKGSLVLTGSAAITLANGSVTAIGTNETLSIAKTSTVQGTGTISNFGITNAGTLSSNQGTLTILPSSAGLINTGAIKVGAGDTMQIGTSAGGALTNFSSVTNTLTGGIYSLTGTLQFGSSGTNIATNAANITLNGAGQMIDFGSNNILAGFNSNASTGVFKLASAASLTTNGGSFTNLGTFTVSTGTTFTVGGSSFNFNQNGGTAMVNGTLTSTTLGTLAVNGGTLDGTGTLGYNVVDASILTPGDSATVTGRLTVADTYTQQSTGALDIQINGAAAATKYDYLKVTQGATLGGTLNIDLGSGFTPTVGETFTILTASSVTGTFATVNGIVINGSEYFKVTYNHGSVVLTVVSGTPSASSPASSALASRLIPAPVHRGSSVSVKGRYGLGVFGQRMAPLPVIAPALSMARTPVSLSAAPVAPPVSFGMPATGMHGFRPMDQFASPALAPAPATTGDAGAAGAFGISSSSAASYNSMGSMNHMRFECGVDLKALLQTSRKRLVRGLWAAPDSPDALYLGYMSYTGSH